MRKVTPEGIVLRAVKEILRMKGWYVMRIQQGMGCHRGISDLIAIKEGITIYIETKSPNWKGKLNKDQEQFKNEIEDHGGTVLIIDSIDEAMRRIK